MILKKMWLGPNSYKTRLAGRHNFFIIICEDAENESTLLKFVINKIKSNLMLDKNYHAQTRQQGKWFKHISLELNSQSSLFFSIENVQIQERARVYLLLQCSNFLVYVWSRWFRLWIVCSICGRRCMWFRNSNSTYLLCYIFHWILLLIRFGRNSSVSFSSISSLYIHTLSFIICQTGLLINIFIITSFSHYKKQNCSI